MDYSNYTLEPDVFAAMFPREIQAYCDRLRANLNAEIEEAEEAEREAEEAERRAEEAEREAEKAEREAEKFEHLLSESMRENICEILKVRGLLEEIPQDLNNRLNGIAAYEPLKDVLTAARTAENYDAFLQTLENVVQ